MYNKNTLCPTTKLIIRYYCKDNAKNKILPNSTLKVIKREQLHDVMKDVRRDQKLKAQTTITKEDKGIKVTPCERINEMNIQMLSENIYNQLFGGGSKVKIKPSTDDRKSLERCKINMRTHGIEIKDSPRLPEVHMTLPELSGGDILEHFYNISEKLSAPYRNLVEKLINNEIPTLPKKWVFKPGWYKYNNDGSAVPVDYPPEDALIFDVEVCMSVGSNPTIACAMSSNNWYGWVSDILFNESSQSMNFSNNLEYLIPLESSKDYRGFNLNGDILNPKIIVGHNVSYDRSRIKEQYWIERTGARFLDTMSLHVCVSGVTSYQRAILKSKNKDIDPDDENWMRISSLNSLSEVHKLYCGTEISKEARNVFLEGNLQDVRDDFQNLMTYCSGDVIATSSVLKALFPMFRERFPHPATLGGMLELSTAYLPVNSNWNEYINNSDVAYEDVELESRLILSRKADEACKLLHDDRYKDDMWLWDQDWSVQKLKMNKHVTKKSSKKSDASKENQESIKNEVEKEIDFCFDHKGNFIDSTDDKECNSSDVMKKLKDKFKYLYETKASLPKVRPLLPGYPAWYRKLCNKPTNGDDWQPGPVNITTSMQITPKLLSLTWEGYPLHYIRGEGWGFLVPFKHERSPADDDSSGVPFETIVKNCPVLEQEMNKNDTKNELVLSNLRKDVENEIGKREFYARAKKDKTGGVYTGTGLWSGVVLSDCCYFMKLPHKDGTSKRVGNPLARDFLSKFSENVLSGSGEDAQKIITSARMLSYWRNNRDRIKDQIVIWLPKKDLPNRIVDTNKDTVYGAILPQVVVCGTLTRRATEPTWMTASNAQAERIGSELRSMIQSPPGYNFVGADVDSQELWISSILGDSQFGFHGATPFGWMTISGSKAAGTDMHSHTATAANITRDHAKVINYARIYGAGQYFAERLLKQFNPSISDRDAKSKALKMFTTTKGKKIYRLKEEFVDSLFSEDPNRESQMMSSYQAMNIAKTCGKSVAEMFETPKWAGGTESAMFNQLEKIARSEEPKTPFLDCKLTRALMTQDEFRERQLPTMVNWVVQSGAVDFLHLMLVNMAWLTGSKARFCLSFHDELRYMVPSEYKYNAALAMHITNLFTRAFCAKKLGLDDVPQSVAFFTSVDVDTVLRKEAHMDCVTPSNPHGLSKGYNIPRGESLDIWQTLEKSEGSLGKLFEHSDSSSKKKNNDKGTESK